MLCPNSLISSQLGVTFQKRPSDGKMKHIAFIKDPDSCTQSAKVASLPLFTLPNRLVGR
jgi:hypothetical protein